MKKEIVRLGIVGLGRGLTAGASVAKDDNVCLAAICDKNPVQIDKAKAFLEKEDIPVPAIYDDYDEMLKSDIDAVYIATDAVCHVPFVTKAMEAGKHVISEIPVANTLEEAKQLKAVVKAHPELKYMTAENACYVPFVKPWKDYYDAGKLGEAVYAESTYIHAPDYRDYNPQNYANNHWRSYNPAIKYLTHNLGPLLYIMNDRCVSVSCMSADVKYNPYKTNGRETDVAIFKTAKGAVIRILICFGAYVGCDHMFLLYGTRGSAETNTRQACIEASSFFRLAEMRTADRGMPDKFELPAEPLRPDEQKGNHGGADVKMMRAFIRCIVDDTAPPIDVDMGIRMTIPGIIANESAMNGGQVMEIPEI